MMPILLSIIAILATIIIHEVAHGYIAYKLGDNTAKQSGRLSLNPLKHLDLIGTIVIPLVLFFSKAGFIFGWAKPVPVNYANLKHAKRDMLLIASAGILANILTAIFSSIILHLILMLPAGSTVGLIAYFCINMIFFNIIFAVFNLLPIPPLDGSKIMLGWSENKKVQKFLQQERAGIVIIILIAFIIPAFLQSFGITFNPLSSLLRATTQFIANIFI